MVVRETSREQEAKHRLNPPRTSANYAVLVRLRKTIEELIEVFVKEDRGVLVDYGCGAAPYRLLFEPYIEKYLGADLSTNIDADLTLEEGSFRVPLDDGTADFVLSTQVLEHVENPAEYLAEAKRLLKPGGKIILTTHGFWVEHADPVDYWRWTSDGLKKLFADEGWDVIGFEGVLGAGAAGLQIMYDAMRGKLPKFIKPIFSLIVQLKICVIDSFYTKAKRRHNAAIYAVVARPSSSAE